MTRSRWASGVALGALATLAFSSGSANAQEVVRNLVASAEPEPFTADDLLWMEVKADSLNLTESMNVYASRRGVYVPLGEFSRVLDLAVGVFPAQRRAEGWILSQDRTVAIDLTSRTATLAGRAFSLAPGQAVIYDDDIYIRTDLLEQLLPVRVRTDVAAQIMTVVPTEPLPFQQRLAREQRQAGLGHAPAAVTPERIQTPYRLFTPPAFDVNVGAQAARDGSQQSHRFDIRAAGDLLFTGMEAYVGSDDDGELSDARVMFTRKDPGGRALGPLGGTRAGIGDVYTPSMPIGAAGLGGRGVFYTSAPLEALDLATPLNLRGELAVGEEVELYVNEVLQGAQVSPVQGRYEFLDVPLTYGLNTIRLVFYGSHGQTREEVRRVNFGSGQLAPGKVVVRLGAVEQGTPLIDVGGQIVDPEAGAERLTAMIDYGLTANLTISAGAARYTPQGREARSLFTAGARGSLGAMATQGDLAFDDQGGRGLTLGLAARPFDMGLVLRHSEYTGGFIDETRQLGVAGDSPLRRATDLRLDGQFTGPSSLNVPYALDLRRLEREDGSRLTTAEARASAPINRFYVSSSVAMEDEKRLDFSRRRFVGATDIATIVAARAQLRAGLNYEISPDARIQSAYATADVQLSDVNTLRFGAVRAVDTGETTLQASALHRAERFDVALNAAYETTSGEWRVGLQLGFGFGYDPFDRRYRMVRPGAAQGGAVAVNAWVDENADGVRQPDEPAVPNLVVETPGGAAPTDANGRVRLGNLGDGAQAVVRLNAEAIDDPFLTAGAPVVEITPRPGRTAVIEYPLRRTAEVEVNVALERPTGPARALAALGVQLVPVKGGEVFTARSDHAGTAFFEGVPPGEYEVMIDPAQRDALGLELTTTRRVVVTPQGGFVRLDDVVVKLTKELPR